jgi:hypothetical protein
MSLLSTALEQGLTPDIIDDTNPDDIYLGYFKYNANRCIIKRITKETVFGDMVTTIKFPVGKFDYLFNWADRKTLSYRFRNFPREFAFNNPLDSVFLNSISLNIKVFLSAMYNSGTGIMNIGANHQYIPLSHPYNCSPWNYNGGESVLAIPSDVVDWVLVGLRQAATPAQATPGTIIGRRVGLLKSNGSIVDLDGISPLVIQTSAIGGNMYPVVYHRNCLTIMGNNSITLNNGVYSYDFTAGLDKVYGGLNGCNFNDGLVVKMASGDINQDEIIDNGDNKLWQAEFGKTAGYFTSDLDMDGSVFVNDSNILYGNINKFNIIPK